MKFDETSNNVSPLVMARVQRGALSLVDIVTLEGLLAT